jgi:hypothetical protein
MDEIEFDLSCFDLSDTPVEPSGGEYEIGGEIDWLEAASVALRTPLPAPMPRERAPRGSSAGIELIGFERNEDRE